MTTHQPAPTELASAVHTLKILTVNTHKGFTALNRRFILPELRDAVRTLSADMVFLQEVHGTHEHHAKRYENWPPTPQYEFLADSMWPQFAYGRNAVYPHGDHGNALLSKFPILRHENLDISIGTQEQRGLLHSVLDVPGHAEVHAICVHLGLREIHRKQQLGLLCKILDRLPSDAPVIVAGDFNDWRQRADGLLAASGLKEAFVSEHGKPAKSFPARWPLLRLDRIYVRNATTHNPQVLSTRPWTHLSDHAPLAVEIRL
ncbi:endonuclease/exonuclease/phosphatase family protein [Pseudomonas argentinensis]|uniref:Metal-dependent hydrolase, endonuclease/exonuclease/phosphatase family n=1 Tax=Phytopseudomonas argentinensis TaxID=289370 RepID=A0A1I3GQ82_9GAMM|nr:endonuclease/exonuclease/phosphatase family protein [Pseudomonas argentinensis]KAB0548971.1 endonuclease/exonuclease/phosphatase family protein [Pseudomonas argentinensis]SFI25544.1 Metal-dependent hydrolase, endonuclease/exonuclease/phosphatase family [Pseudomonas argentinensis]